MLTGTLNLLISMIYAPFSRINSEQELKVFRIIFKYRQTKGVENVGFEQTER